MTTTAGGGRFRFDEKHLRDQIVKTWGGHGAHAELFDILAKKAALADRMDTLLRRIINCGLLDGAILEEARAAISPAGEGKP